jgi:hypothetical protein
MYQLVKISNGRVASDTIINVPTGQNIVFKINNSTIGTVSTTGIQSSLTPTVPNDYCNKSYVDDIIVGTGFWTQSGSYVEPKSNYYIQTDASSSTYQAEFLGGTGGDSNIKLERDTGGDVSSIHFTTNGVTNSDFRITSTTSSLIFYSDAVNNAIMSFDSNNDVNISNDLQVSTDLTVIGVSNTADINVSSTNSISLISNASHEAITIKGSTASTQNYIRFVNDDDTSAGFFGRDTNDGIILGIETGDFNVKYLSGSFLTALNVNQSDGSIALPAVYGDSVTGNPLYIDSNGNLGLTSSILASKINILDIGNVDWVYNLDIKKYNKRLKDVYGNYTDNAHPEQQVGVIAEDLVNLGGEALNFCYYDTIREHETECNEEHTDINRCSCSCPTSQRLRGVSYTKFIPVLLKVV